MSGISRNWCRAGLDKRKTRVIYEGVDINKFIPGKKREDSRLRLVCVGRIEKSKGQLQILQSMARLPEKVRKNVTLDLIGESYPDYFRQLQSYIKRNGLEDKVRFLGYQDKIPELLAGYDVGILSSRGDAFGTVVAEYMAAGLLAIATYTELAEHQKTGLRYEFGDIEKLAENIQYAYENRTQTDRIAEAGAAAIRENYSIEANASEVYKLYQNMVS